MLDESKAVSYTHLDVYKRQGVHNCVGASAGILAPAITGLLVERTGQFYYAFMLAAGVSVIGLIAWTVALPKIAPIRWDNADEGGARPTGSAATLP